MKPYHINNKECGKTIERILKIRYGEKRKIKYLTTEKYFYVVR